MPPTLEEEMRLLGLGLLPAAGLDEVGRGCWAGPLVAAAVVLPVEALVLCPERLSGVDDSKRLSARRREVLAGRIYEVALGVGLGVVSPALVDALGIVRATGLAMRRALARLPLVPRFLLVDGRTALDLPFPQRLLVRGDARCLSIAAASIVAKVYRDRWMVAWAERYPLYGFEKHKGYGTAGHRRALERWGPCPLHRRSFSPVRALGR
ncbi:MAG: ribonuclease HII [Chloroflexia bacterium]